MSHATSDSIPIQGECSARFAAVRAAFETNFAEEDEIGAALCIRVAGQTVIDLWGGYMDAARTRPWQRDTLINAYSVGKGVMGVLVANLVEHGALGYDMRVSDVWPEYAAHGKGDTSLRTLLSHRAGMPAVRERLPDAVAYDWDRMCDALARQAAWWEPGSDHGYHVNTYGFLAGEVVRRATGLAVEAALERWVAGPAGGDFYYRLPDSEHKRVADTCTPYSGVIREEDWARAFPPTGNAEHDQMIWHAYFNPLTLSGIGSVNSAAWRRAVIPSTNGHGTARAVAAIYSAFLLGGPEGSGWAGRAVREQATRIHSDGTDRVLGRPSRFGLGFQLAQPTRPLGPSPNAFGHYGNGGSLGFADPDAELAFGYLMNRPGQRWQTPRTNRLIDAVYACL